MKRVKIFRVSAEIFVDLFLTIQKGEWIGVEGIPDDLRVLNVDYDLQMMQFKILVESQSFPEVFPNAMPPEFEPRFSKYSTQGWDKKETKSEEPSDIWISDPRLHEFK